MAYKLNEKLKKFTNYEVTDGEYRIRLDANESFIDPGIGLHNRIIDALSKVPLNRYPDDSCKELRKAFGTYYGVDPALVVAGNGSDELISLLIGSFMKKDEKIVTLTPDFSMYKVFADIFERECIEILKDEDLSISTDYLLEELKRINPQAIIFSNPSSPTGLVKKRSEIVKILENTDALVIVDEAYMDFSTESVLDLVEEFDNLIVLKTSSKALGCAAIRLGFAVSSREIVKVLNALRPPYNLNSVTQAIGCAIFSEPEFIKESVSRIIESRNYLYQGIKSLVNSKIEKIYESETNYIYIKTKFAKHIYEELCKRSILIRKFDNSLRITAGTISENDEVIKSVKEILDSLN